MSAVDLTGVSGPTYASFIREQATLQDAYKESMERRALAVITSSATIATLLFGMLTFVSASNAAFRLKPEATPLMGIAVVLFALAAIAGVAVNRPMPYWRPKTGELDDLVNLYWDGTRDEAEQWIAQAGLKTLKSAYKWNDWKARLLFGAAILEGLAVLALGVGLAISLFAP